MIGQSLLHYRIKDKLGAGGMGEVYLAEHQLMKRPCAVKVIRPEKAGDPRVLARFELFRVHQPAADQIADAIDLGRSFEHVGQQPPGQRSPAGQLGR